MTGNNGKGAVYDLKRFSLDNYSVCWYCSRSVLPPAGNGGRISGCYIRRDSRGRPAEIVYGEANVVDLRSRGISAVNEEFGCGDFEPSGLAAHPDVLKTLIHQNRACSAIPEDSNAMERGNDFLKKRDRYISHDANL